MEALLKAGNTALTQVERQQRDERQKRLTTDIDYLRSECEKSKADAPYGEETRGLLSCLFERARRKKNWSLAQACADDLLKIYSHFSQADTSAEIAQVNLASMYVEEGNFDGAKALYDKLMAHSGLQRTQMGKPAV